MRAAWCALSAVLALSACAGKKPSAALSSSEAASVPEAASKPGRMTPAQRAEYFDYFDEVMDQCYVEKGKTMDACDAMVQKAGCDPGWSEPECGRHLKGIGFLK